MVLKRAYPDASASPAAWQPPADWVSLPSITASDQKIALRVGVRDTGDATQVAFKIITSAGDVAVDWGDGTAGTFTSNTTIDHSYDYADLTGLTTDGFRQAICVITPATANITGIDFDETPTGWTGNYSSPILEKVISGPNATSITFGSAHDICRSVKVVSAGVTSLASSLNGMPALAYSELDCDSVTSLFLSHLNTSIVASTLTNVGSLTNASRAYEGTDITSLDLSGASALSNISQILKNASSVTDVNINCTSVTNTTEALLNCGSIVRLLMTGLTVGVDVSDCMMGANALDAFYTSLGTANGAQTITVTGNEGTGGHTPSIATNKGYTLVA